MSGFLDEVVALRWGGGWASMDGTPLPMTHGMVLGEVATAAVAWGWSAGCRARFEIHGRCREAGGSDGGRRSFHRYIRAPGGAPKAGGAPPDQIELAARSVAMQAASSTCPPAPRRCAPSAGLIHSRRQACPADGDHYARHAAVAAVGQRHRVHLAARNCGSANMSATE